MTTTSRSERAKLAVQILKEFEVEKRVISAAQQEMNEKLHSNDNVDDETPADPEEGVTQKSTANEVEMTLLGTAGATDQTTGNTEDASNDNPLRSQMDDMMMEWVNQGISASAIRDFAEEFVQKIESEKMNDDDTNLEIIHEDEVNVDGV